MPASHAAQPGTAPRPRHPRRTAVLVLMLFVAAVTACGKKNPTSPSSGGLPGTWSATRAEFVDRANSSRRIEVISRGSTIVLMLNAGGTFTMTTTEPGRAPEPRSGAWTSTRDVLTLRPTDITGETQFDYTLSGDTLTLSGGHVLFDVNGDDVDDEAELNMVLSRQ